MPDEIEVEVAYLHPDHQFIRQLTVEANSSVDSVLKISGLFDACPELGGTAPEVGIFGKVVSLDQVVRANDRVEVYRELVFDPKEARRKRAAKAKP